MSASMIGNFDKDRIDGGKGSDEVRAGPEDVLARVEKQPLKGVVL